MNKNVKISSVEGFILYGLAAAFSVCLLLVLFDFTGMNPAQGTLAYRIGKMFANSYGFSSVLIPAFLLVAAFQCFTASWRTRNGVMLLGSVIPFFTIDAVEHICHIFAANNSGDVMAMKIGAAVLTGAVVIAVEYLVLSMIGDIVESLDEKEERKNAALEKKAVEEELERAAAVLEGKKKDDAEVEGGIEAYKAGYKKNDEIEVMTVPLEDSQIDDDEEPAETDEENPFAHIFDDQVVEVSAVEADREEAESDYVIETEPLTIQEEEADDEEEIEASGSDIETEEVIAPEEPAAGDIDEEMDTEENIEQNQEIEQGPLPEENWEYREKPLSDVNTADSEIDTELPDDFEDVDSFNESIEESVENEALEVPDLTEEFEEETAFEDNLQEEENQPEPFEDYDFPSELEEYEEKNSSLNEVVEYFSDEQGPDTEVTASEFVETETGLDFGDATISSEIGEEEEENDLSDFVEERNNSFESIFAKMGADAAQNPAGNGSEIFDEDLDSIFNDAEIIPPAANEEIADELPENPAIEGYEFDPEAKPVVDSNGMPYGPAVPLNIQENSFDEVASARKNSKPLGFAEKAVYLQDTEAEEKPAKKAEMPAPVEQVRQKPKLKISNYKIPVEGILTKYDNGEYWVVDDETKKKADDLTATLREFNIEVKVTGIRKGPVVTMFEVLPAPGVNVNRIRTLQDNIALRLAATSVRIVSPIPGKSAVGIEIPNKSRAIVSYREIIEKKNPAFEKMAIPVILGKDISGDPQIIDLAKTPHLLIAGSTGAGKSVCVNSLILSILYKRNPQQVKLILIDPKVVELKLYNDIPHLLTPVITEPKKALQSLQYCLCEMERRYAMLDNMGVRDISSYNRRIEERKLMQEKLPYIVVIIDEFADLMATTGKELESNVARLAAMSRAVGIHLVLATQRPSVNVITGLIKANIPSRIAFMVASRTDSNIIIDQIGAEKLLGKGDMLYASATDPFPVRIQGTLVSDDEVEKVVEYVKQYGEPDYIDDEIFVEDDEDGDGNPGLFSDGEDALYDQALQIVLQSGKASASYLQRRLKIGYNRAARLVEEMEERGIVGPQNGSKPREVIYVP